MFNTTAPTFAKIYRKIFALRCLAVFDELILDKTRQKRRATNRFTEAFNAVLDEISHQKPSSIRALVASYSFLREGQVALPFSYTNQPQSRLFEDFNAVLDEISHQKPVLYYSCLV